MSEPTNPLEVLKSAILLERRGRAFYRKVSAQSEHPAVREFFEMMAAEEEQHVAVLATQFKSYRENGEFATISHPPQKRDEVAEAVLSRQLKEEISAADFEAAAVSAAMSLEKRAIDLYSSRAETAEDPQEKALYEWLAGWERSHLSFLAEVDQEIREQVWHDQSFWPF